jgi:hypothetical protein
MNKLFEIDENEKRRILEMHETATKNLYLVEQGNQQQQPQATVTIEGKPYKLPGIVDKASLESLIGDDTFTPEELSQFNKMIGTDLKMELTGGQTGPGLGLKALRAVKGSLDYLAQKISSKESLCGANFSDDQLLRVDYYDEVKRQIASLTPKKLSDVVNSKIKSSQYCRS